MSEPSDLAPALLRAAADARRRVVDAAVQRQADETALAESMAAERLAEVAVRATSEAIEAEILRLAALPACEQRSMTSDVAVCVLVAGHPGPHRFELPEDAP